MLGYATLHRVADESTRNSPDFQIPSAYHVVEIDAAGEALTELVTLDGAGWGDMDQWTTVGAGEVAWVYIPSPEIQNDPGCSSDTLQVSYYRANE